MKAPIKHEWCKMPLSSLRIVLRAHPPPAAVPSRSFPPPSRAPPGTDGKRQSRHSCPVPPLGIYRLPKEAGYPPNVFVCTCASLSTAASIFYALLFSCLYGPIHGTPCAVRKADSLPDVQ